MRRLALIGLILLFQLPDTLASIRWDSAATGTTIEGELRKPENRPAVTEVPTIIYLKNLAIPRIGQEADESIIQEFLKQDYLVLVLDYAHDPHAKSPELNADVLKLRQDISGKTKTLLADEKIDLNHIFILLEGFRIKRDVEFARDGSRVLGMEIIYPSNPSRSVPVLMEITCDNQNRMGNSSLLFCHDSLIEGAEAAGFAVAMIDHPVPPPYKGIDDPMPQCIYRLKSAVRTLRAFAGESKLNENIGAIGFSRGGPMAALLAVTGDRDDMEGDGEHRDKSSRVQAALVHGNRYNYLDLLPNDPMQARFEKAWGPRDTNLERWAEHGAIFYLAKDAAPMFLNTSNAESPEYQDGLSKLDKQLTQTGIEHVYQVDADGRGHRVSTYPKTLSSIYEFFHKHLDPK